MAAGTSRSNARINDSRDLLERACAIAAIGTFIRRITGIVMACLATFTSAAGTAAGTTQHGWETRQFWITPKQARSDIAAGLYRGGLLGRAISLGICPI